VLAAVGRKVACLNAAGIAYSGLHLDHILISPGQEVLLSNMWGMQLLRNLTETEGTATLNHLRVVCRGCGCIGIRCAWTPGGE